ncbi:MAG: hypothetical protein CV087_16830 [Candidatus Brocadia sp. WS118]|nr:MAG: hypothetical protein CV087_16830 [Candidatus Brocadia sp. WS118]
MTTFIIEVANCHGGDKNYLFSLIEEFERFDGHGMKFQPLHPDQIATKDFEWYPVYQKLLFNASEWSEIISKAAQTKKIWLDLFDTYGVQILNENLSLISGIKLQASILYNEQVINALKVTDCSNLRLIINVSALSIDEIRERLESLEAGIAPKEILLEVGFQSYPTLLEDSGLNKLHALRSQFENSLVFADHVEGTSEDAITLPLIASTMGADIIEKHVMHSKFETKYDHFSAIKHDVYEKLVTKINQYAELPHKPFINDKEKRYLSNSIQIPLAGTGLPKGHGISVSSDLNFKRSGQKGLSVTELKKLINEKNILAVSVDEGSSFKKEYFKKATIATIIAGRLKSSRLKRKAILKIGDLPSIEKCIQSCLRIKDTNYTVLATSTVEEDAELEQYTYSSAVHFHRGHPEDVIQRYLDVTDKYNIDVVIRVTADMPYVSPEIAEILLKSHFESGADYTAAKAFSVGTAPEIINTQALQTVKEHFPSADYSEYMTWYFQNNKEHFRVNIVELPARLVRDYRLTVDYQEDLDMMNKLQDYFDEHKMEGTTEELFSFLDAHKTVAEINGHIGLKYKTDSDLINTLNIVTKIS